ncbi:CYFA0S08e00826g1_1 [Cyberlindnera fabianii]|uniref:CYFA0S08e00826g1_1 n=1 Tax=Cyberlindnera fabianii TaxID=36022 RepID=A0A061B2G1_CYBFA|nr:Stomatin-2 [Cyberlindnera fabianii]CDR41854.1 CYFA0S08e00826g1_1 [Cyberlindnera fabianii]
MSYNIEQANPSIPEDSIENESPYMGNKRARAPAYVNDQPIAIENMRYSKEFETKDLGAYQTFLNNCGKFFGTLAVIPGCCCFTNPWTEVKQGYVGLVTKFGELARIEDPGATYVNTFSEKMTQVTIMTQLKEIPEQACLTKDNVIVYLRSVIYYNIVDPQRAIYGIHGIDGALSERTQTTLRDVIGSRVLQDVIERREEVADAIHDIIAQTAASWGVRVESILIKDLRLPNEITQALSQAAQAKRIGESKIITAKAEVESAKLMRQAADILASKPAMQIRYLDAMQSMAKSANSKVIFMPSSDQLGNIANNASGKGQNGGEPFQIEDPNNITEADVHKFVNLNEGLK